ncbi:MAG: alpha/beta hydrolase [Phycisphaerae bacterium]
MNTDQSIILADGRRLSFAEFGRPDGEPVFYFHGAPSSRLEPLLVGDERLARLGLRVIAPDRPGIGGSSFQPRRRITDWPADVQALADALRLERFSVLGNSGGGPYVAVCAARIPRRLRSAVIVSGGWRMDWPEARAGLPVANRVMLTLARRAPFVLRLLMGLMGGVSEGNREAELAGLKKRMPPADFAAFAEPGRLEAFGETMRECLRQGARGPTWDFGLYVRDFSFDLAEVRMPIALFHGEQDVNAPIAMVRRAVAALPAARLVTYPSEAHLSTLCNHFDEIARALVAPAGAAGPLQRVPAAG